MRSGSAVIDRTPPTVDDGGGGGGGWAWVMTARGIIEGELVRGLLEGSGILPVALDAHDPSPGSWMYLSGNVNALVRVYVPASMLDDARLVLLEAGFAVDDAVVAPASPARRHGRRRFAFVLVFLALLAVTLLLQATTRGGGTCISGVIC